jgi:hypothetical protein
MLFNLPITSRNKYLFQIGSDVVVKDFVKKDRFLLVMHVVH